MSNKCPEKSGETEFFSSSQSTLEERKRMKNWQMTNLDPIDLQILRELQQNARLTTKELAARVNLSTTPVFERVKRLER